MAEYQLTPYAVKLYPSGDRSSPRKMGHVDPAKPGLSALDAVTNTFAILSQEADPRRRSDDRERQLDVISVRRGVHQVEITCSLGVAGFNSRLDLEALDIPAVRRHGDTEWFDLRVVFAASPTARSGILLVEGIGNFGIVSHVSELIKLGFRANTAGQTVAIEPIQDAEAWGETFAGLTAQALEFRSLVKTDDIADEAAVGGKPIPLSKIIKITRRGGLGPYRTITGRSVKDLADRYGVGRDVDGKTWAVATLAGPDNRKRKINVEENKVSSISFQVKRDSVNRPPTPDEFYDTAMQIVDDVRTGIGLGSVDVGALDDTEAHTIENIDSLKWTVPDEVASDQHSN